MGRFDICTCTPILLLFLLVGTAALNLLHFDKEKASKPSPSISVLPTATAMSASRIVATGKPYLIYGTAWKKEKTAHLVEEAIKAGFRFIDTACQPRHYNEGGVGQGWTTACAQLNLKREDLYLQTKFTPPNGQDPNNIPYDPSSPLEEQVNKSLDASLQNLQTTYLDALLLHSPYNGNIDDTMTVWRTFESFVQKGIVKKIGISNCYDLNFFQTLYEQATIKPSMLQNRFYSESNFDDKLRQYCKNRDVSYQSFWTLTANRDALGTMEIQNLAQKKNLSPQTLMYAFMMSLSEEEGSTTTPLCGTTDKGHMMEDVEVMNRVWNGEEILNEEEIQYIAKILGVPDEDS